VPHVRTPVRARAGLFYRGHVSQLWRGRPRHRAGVADHGVARAVVGRGAAGARAPAHRGIALAVPVRAPAVAAPRPYVRPPVGDTRHQKRR
jgi:hypothetical protein